MNPRRKQAESTIHALYAGTDTGDALLKLLIEEMGMAALTDAAVVKLAQMHIRAEERSLRRMERELKSAEQGR
jgi:hypothetical protein